MGMCSDSYREKVGSRDVIKCRRQDGNICPYVYWCNKIDDWRPLRDTQDTCKLRTNDDVPKSASVVRFEKKGKLYIENENSVIAIDNPFDFVPKYVTLMKGKNGVFYINKKKGFK